MVVDKGHRVALIVVVGGKALVVQGAPCATAKGAVHRILQREVKHGALDTVVLLGLVQPPAQRLGIAVPVLTHREHRLAGLVVQADVVACVALAHVIAETVIAQFLHEVLLIGLDVLLYVGTGVVQVAAAVKVLALVGSTGSGIAGSHALVGAANVGQCPRQAVGITGHGAGHALVSQVHPAAFAALVVDDHVHQHAGVMGVQGADHLTQLRLGAETGVVLQPINGHVTHTLRGAIGINATRVGNPHHIEVLAQILSVLSEVGPLGGFVAVPIEALQHHAAIHRRPTLAGNGAATAVTRDDTGAVVHVDGDGVGTGGNAERDIDALAKVVQRDGLAQHRRCYPEVAIAHRSQAIGCNAVPVGATRRQLGREREIAHVGILFGPFSIEGHLSGEHVAVGSTHFIAD